MACCVLLVDIADAAVLGAARQALQQLGTSLCLAAPAAAGAAAPHRAPVLGLCNLAQPPQAAKPVLQVRCRPGPLVLRDFHGAAARLAASGGGVSGAVAAAALQQLVDLVARDPACAAAGSERAVLYVTDRADYEPADFRTCLEVRRGGRPGGWEAVGAERPNVGALQGGRQLAWSLGRRHGGVWPRMAPHPMTLTCTPASTHVLHPACPPEQVCRSKGVRVELVVLSAEHEAAPALAASGDDDASTPGSSTSGSGSAALEAVAAAWAAAEAAFPHLSVSLVPGASKLSFDQLTGTLLQRFAVQPRLAVNLQVGGRACRAPVELVGELSAASRVSSARPPPFLRAPICQSSHPSPLQFKQPLVGSIRALHLSCQAEVQPLAQSVRHAALCPCHHAPAAWAAGAAACCSVTGAPLDSRQCGCDERTVQVGLG